jgi:uncharacterized membrane protein YedE/YeeE
MSTIAAVVTLVIGVLIGYLGQKVRLCFIGGMRDLYLVRDTHQIKGLFGLIIGAAISYALFSVIGGAVPSFPWFLSKGITPITGDPLTTVVPLPHVILAVAGGLGLGLFSVFAGGCPFRQHVMAAEGNKSAIAYLVGFYVAAVIFTLYIAPLERLIFP